MEVNLEIDIVLVADHDIMELYVLVLAEAVAVAHKGTETQVDSLVGCNLKHAVALNLNQFVAVFPVRHKHQVLGIDNPCILCGEDEVHIVVGRADKLQR